MMKLTLTTLSCALLTLGLSVPGRSAVISATIPEFTGNFFDFSASYPLPATTIGTFTYKLPAGAVILGATVSGSFGNSGTNSTALSDYFVGAVKAASCSLTSDPCFDPASPFDPPTPWSYTFTPAQLASLQSGSVDFSVVQNGAFQVQSGVVELDVTTSPEPATVLGFCGGLAMLAALRCKRRV